MAIRPTSHTLKGLIEQIAGNVQHASQPAMLLFGTVTKVNPLEIMTDQQHNLTEPFLVLTNAVKDHAVDITVGWQTVADAHLKPAHTHGNGNNGSPTSSTSDFDTTHHHDIKGRKKIIIHNGLTVGENVILFRTLGGQQYVVLDRVEEATISGEWNE